MRFVLVMDGGGPDNTTVLNAPSFKSALGSALAVRPKATRVELRLISEADAGGGAGFRWGWRLRLLSWIARLLT